MPANKPRRPQRHYRAWSPAEIRRMLCNPIYAPILVDPVLAQHRPEEYNRQVFLDMANGTAQEFGNDRLMRSFVRDLKKATMWTRFISVHEALTLHREAFMTEEQFIQAGVTQLGEIGLEGYFTRVLDNLAQGSLSFS